MAAPRQLCGTLACERSTAEYASGLVFLTAILPLWEADVAGKWKGQMGETHRELVFELKSRGAKISGTVVGPGGEPVPSPG